MADCFLLGSEPVALVLVIVKDEAFQEHLLPNLRQAKETTKEFGSDWVVSLGPPLFDILASSLNLSWSSAPQAIHQIGIDSPTKVAALRGLKPLLEVLGTGQSIIGWPDLKS